MISKSSAKSIEVALAYIKAEKVKCPYLGRTFNYKRKEDEVVYTNIMLCKNAPKEYQDSKTLWNAVKEVEKAENAQLARAFEFALPVEFTLEENIALTNDIVRYFVDEGMCLEYAIHDKPGNPHCHALATTRQIDEEGKWMSKEKKVYVLDENGNRIPVLNSDGTQKVDSRNRKKWKRKTIKVNDWNSREKFKEWRKAIAHITNKHLEMKNIDQRISELSYAEQYSFLPEELQPIPTMHEGYSKSKLVVEDNIMIKESNEYIYNAIVEHIISTSKNLKVISQSVLTNLRKHVIDIEEKIYGPIKRVIDSTRTAIIDSATNRRAREIKLRESTVKSSPTIDETSSKRRFRGFKSSKGK